jgi:hypothetical protein
MAEVGLRPVCPTGRKRARRDGENSETDTWLDFALDCGYLEQSDHLHLTTECKEIGSMLGSMLKKPGIFYSLNLTSHRVVGPYGPEADF